MAEDRVRDVVYVAVVTGGGLALLQRSQDDDTEPDKLGLVAGGVEPGESHASAAVREVKEEAGLKIGEEQLVYLGGIRSYVIKPHGGPNGEEKRIMVRGPVYLLDVGNEIEAGDIVLDPHEHVGIRFVGSEELMGVRETGELPASSPVAPLARGVSTPQLTGPTWAIVSAPFFDQVLERLNNTCQSQPAKLHSTV